MPSTRSTAAFQFVSLNGDTLRTLGMLVATPYSVEFFANTSCNHPMSDPPSILSSRQVLGAPPLTALRSHLVQLSPTEFEAISAAALSGILERPFRQAAAGRQPGGDAGGGNIRLEAKRYRTGFPETRDLLGGLTSAINAVPDLSHWVVTSTASLPLQTKDELAQAAGREQVYDVILDWPTAGLPPLAVALVAGRAEVEKIFPRLAEILDRLAQLPEVIEAGQDLRDRLRSSPPGRPIYSPVLHYVKGMSDSAVLDPRYRVVPLMNRDREMADWVAWAEHGNGMARLLTGDGGMGKTRLLIEVCERLRSEGWRVGFLRDKADYESLCRQLAGAGKVFVVVDYAERRSADIETLCQAVQQTGASVKLALLARRDGPWREDLLATSQAASHFLGDEEGITIRELEPTAPLRVEQTRRSRQLIFADAIGEFQQIRGTITHNLANLWGRMVNFDNQSYDRILFLLLEAWVAVFNGRNARPRNIVQVILSREQRYLTKLAPEGVPPRTMMEVLGWIYAHQGAETRRDAITLLRQCPSLENEPATRIAQVAEVFHDAYGGPKWLNPIQPDLIGHAVQEKYGP